MVDIVEFLAFLVSFNILSVINLSGQPIVTGADDFGYNAQASGVHSSNSYVHFVQDVLLMVFSDPL